MKSIKIIFVLILLAGATLAQTTYKIPFASQGNVIELAIANTQQTAVKNVTVELEEIPMWVKFDKCEIQIDEIKENEEGTAEFKFNIDRQAPVGEKESLKFKIKNENGEEWSKEINIIVEVPAEYKLYQNYPNPFNPATTITYQLPAKSRVQIKVYDILGRVAASLVDEEQSAGSYDVKFDGSRLSSGTYLCRIEAEGYTETIKLMLLK